MKISIDTRDESKEDIRKVIRMLQHIVDGTDHSENLGGSSSGYVNIFGDDAPSSPSLNEPEAPSEPAAPGIFSIFDDPPKTEESGEIEPETITLEGNDEETDDDDEKQGSAQLFTYN